MKKTVKNPLNQASTLFLQAVIVIIAVVTATLLLIEPHLEGRNVDATWYQIYFNDPFLICVYIGAIPFFIALVQAFKLLGYIGKNKVFSQASVNSLKIIKYCSFITAGTVIAVILYLKIASFSNNEDPAGAIMIGNVITFASVVIGTVAAIFEKTLQSAVDIKSENDLTV